MVGMGNDGKGSSDRTLMRPQPGGTRHQQGPIANPAPSLAQGRAVGLSELLPAGRNRLLAAAGPLLTLGGRLQASVMEADMANLHRRAVEAVKQFEADARAARVPDSDLLDAHYVVCTFVDSAVSRTPWGARSDWAGQSMLVTFHKEFQGGEKFFQILQRRLADPARSVDLLELMFVCLALGFEGIYGSNPRDLADIQARVQRAVLAQRSEESVLGLSPHWQGVQDRRSRVMRWVPWWMVGLAGAVVLMASWIFLRAQLAEASQPLQIALANQGLTASVMSAPLPVSTRVSTVRLKTLLSEAEQRGWIQVEESGNQSRITLNGEAMFASGSANLNVAYAPVIMAIATAIQQVPGSVLVTGHTDDQPVRSLLYPDNFELSRDRARSVATQLGQLLSDPARVEWTGLGDAQPKYQPPNIPDNRRRNRRVEILHTALNASPEAGR